MKPGLPAAAEAASRVRDAAHLRGFKHAVRDFIRIVAAMPDETSEVVSKDAWRGVQSLGEDVIDRIEERVADIPGAADAQELVSAVYEIRRQLEEVGRARQHYAIVRHV